MRKLNTEEIDILKCYFSQDPKWRRDTVKTASTHLNLDPKKVYKWGYDRKMRLLRKSTQEQGVSLTPVDFCHDQRILDQTFDLHFSEATKISNMNSEVDQILDICDFRQTSVVNIEEQKLGNQSSDLTEEKIKQCAEEKEPISGKNTMFGPIFEDDSLLNLEFPSDSSSIFEDLRKSLGDDDEPLLNEEPVAFVEPQASLSNFERQKDFSENEKLMYDSMQNESNPRIEFS